MAMIGPETSRIAWCAAASGDSLFDITLDVFHHHDGVIHHDADRQHQPEQAEGIEREAQQIQRGEGADHGDRDRQQRDDRGAPGLQEQYDHQHHQYHRFQQGIHHRADRIAHEHRRIVRRFPAHAVREAGRQLGHLATHRVRQLDGVGARRLEDTDTDRILVIELGAQRVAAGAHFDARHVAQPHYLAVVAALEDDVAELFFGLQAALALIDSR